jgi:hypothetical protein
MAEMPRHHGCGSAMALSDKLHWRIEFRPLPSGPTVIDMVANSVFFYGIVQYLATRHVDVSELASFDIVEGNFYDTDQAGQEQSGLSRRTEATN